MLIAKDSGCVSFLQPSSRNVVATRDCNRMRCTRGRLFLLLRLLHHTSPMRRLYFLFVVHFRVPCQPYPLATPSPSHRCPAYARTPWYCQCQSAFILHTA